MIVPRLYPRAAALCALLLAALIVGTARPAGAQSASTPAAAAAARHVFIISFDGGKPSVMQQSKMPTLSALVKEGAATWNAQTIFPSSTLPSHTSMLTGVGVAKHQVLWNDWMPERGMVPVPTCLALAKKSGLVTAMFVGKTKFIHLFQPDSLSEFSLPSYQALDVAAAAARYIVAKKPNLCFIHFSDSDGAGHASGWGSPEQIKAFEDEDRALALIKAAIEKAGIADQSAIICSADHGGHDKTHGTNRPDDMTIPWIAWGAGIKKGVAISAPVTTYDTAATALHLLGIAVPGNWDGKPVSSALSSAGVAAAK